MKPGKLKDKILYSRFKQKDREAFIKAYDLYIDSIYRFIFFKVNNKEEAEDLTSLVFLKTWDYIQNNSIEDFKTLKSLFYKVARNLVIDHYRKKSTQQIIIPEIDISEINLADEGQDLKHKSEISDDYKIVQDKLFNLKDEYREAIILRYINELSISEIANIMGKTNGNVRIMIFRALKALRELVEQQ
jgi:RNA polymerase sigma-70 factor (ECF subfamily)